MLAVAFTRDFVRIFVIPFLSDDKKGILAICMLNSPIRLLV